MGSYVVRILKSELWNFKNVKHGVVKYMNYGCVQKYGEIQKKDIVGIYGQNGSGKTALVESLDILKHKNRYINLTGVGANNNNRDFYIKSLTIGGQKEELYDDEDLDSIGYAFRRAGNPEKKNVNLHLSKKILEKIKEEKE